MLMHALRRLGLKQTPLARAQCQTIRLKLLKIGAQVRLTVRHVWISMSEAYPYSEVFAAVVRNLQAIPLRCWVCPDQTPPKTKSFHRSGRALPECIPSRSSEPEKRSIHDPPHPRITRGPDR